MLSSSPFPRWLDPETLKWAADYCEAMAVRLREIRPPGVAGAVAADICAKGLRAAGENAQAQQRDPRCPPLLKLIEGPQ